MDPNTGNLINCVVTDVQCVQYVYEDDSPGGGGGGGYPGPDPGECDPMGTEPCYDGPGGSQPPPPSPDPCEGSNPPIYCQCPVTTGYSALDNRALQMVYEDLWGKQASSNEEQGGFLYMNELGSWQFFELKGPWVEVRTLTEIRFFIPSGLPSGSIYIHTHPTQEALTDFGITNEYQHTPSTPDSLLMVRMSSNNGVAYGVILDPVYRILVGPDGIEVTKVNRCGY